MSYTYIYCVSIYIYIYIFMGIICSTIQGYTPPALVGSHIKPVQGCASTQYSMKWQTPSISWHRCVAPGALYLVGAHTEVIAILWVTNPIRQFHLVIE